MPLSKRREEFKSKIDKVSKETPGDRAKEMIFVDLLCVKPDSQNLGYGSALLKTALSIVSTF